MSFIKTEVMIIKYVKYGILVLVSMVLLNSCSDSLFNCIEGNGVMVADSRDKYGFIEVTSNGSFDVIITYGEIYSVVVHADENLQSHIRTIVIDDELIIETEHDRCLRSRNNIYVEVTMPDLQSAKLSGSGNIWISDFEVPSVDIRLIGSGDIEVENTYAPNLNAYLDGSGTIYLDGEGESANYRLTGSGEIEGGNFLLDECYVTLSGSGEVEVYALEYLDVVISGSGDVYYYGNPILSTVITGSGRIIQR